MPHLPQLPGLCLMLALLVPFGALAQQTQTQSASSGPAVRSVVDGNRQEFFVRFDHPVDHAGSRLEILRSGAEGEVVRVLQPRLAAPPDTLYAATGMLPVGTYVLRWTAKSGRDGSVREGTQEFTVR